MKPGKPDHPFPRMLMTVPATDKERTSCDRPQSWKISLFQSLSPSVTQSATMISIPSSGKLSQGRLGTLPLGGEVSGEATQPFLLTWRRPHSVGDHSWPWRGRGKPMRGDSYYEQEGGSTETSCSGAIPCRRKLDSNPLKPRCSFTPPHPSRGCFCFFPESPSPSRILTGNSLRVRLFLETPSICFR